MRVRMMRGDFVVVEIPDSQPVVTDIVQLDIVRQPNNSPCISASTFHRLSIAVPTDLHAICRDEANHREFKQKCGASQVQFSPEYSALIVLSRDESILKKAALLGDFHMRSLRQKMMLLQLTEESARKLESTRQQPPRSSSSLAGHRADFSVPRDLMGLAIGAQGSNIQRARQLPGVHSIDITEETATFTIVGESEDEVNAARALLEYAERRIQLPRDMISRIIGRNGNNIQSIVDRSGVVRVKIEGDNETPPEAREEACVPFVFVGTVESIDNAKLLLDYHIAHLKEVDELTRQKQQLDAELHHLSVQSRGSSAPYNHSATGEQAPHHGYRDEHGGGREGSAARGRGGPGNRWATNNGNRQNDDRSGLVRPAPVAATNGSKQQTNDRPPTTKQTAQPPSKNSAPAAPVATLPVKVPLQTNANAKNSNKSIVNRQP
jgi:fragile X mental retardation protein